MSGDFDAPLMPAYSFLKSGAANPEFWAMKGHENEEARRIENDPDIRDVRGPDWRGVGGCDENRRERFAVRRQKGSRYDGGGN